MHFPRYKRDLSLSCSCLIFGEVDSSFSRSRKELWGLGGLASVNMLAKMERTEGLPLHLRFVSAFASGCLSCLSSF